MNMNMNSKYFKSLDTKKKRKISKMSLNSTIYKVLHLMENMKSMFEIFFFSFFAHHLEPQRQLNSLKRDSLFLFSDRSDSIRLEIFLSFLYHFVLKNILYTHWI